MKKIIISILLCLGSQTVFAVKNSGFWCDAQKFLKAVDDVGIKFIKNRQGVVTFVLVGTAIMTYASFKLLAEAYEERGRRMAAEKAYEVLAGRISVVTEKK